MRYILVDNVVREFTATELLLHHTKNWKFAAALEGFLHKTILLTRMWSKSLKSDCDRVKFQETC